MIYVDNFNRPVSHANISTFGSNYGRPGTGYLSFHSTAVNAPEYKWDYVSKDVSEIVIEMESKGWTCTVRENNYLAPVIDLVHKETQKIIDKSKKDIEAKFQNAEKGGV